MEYDRIPPRSEYPPPPAPPRHAKIRIPALKLISRNTLQLNVGVNNALTHKFN